MVGVIADTEGCCKRWGLSLISNIADFGGFYSRRGLLFTLGVIVNIESYCDVGGYCPHRRLLLASWGVAVIMDCCFIVDIRYTLLLLSRIIAGIMDYCWHQQYAMSVATPSVG